MNQQAIDWLLSQEPGAPTIPANIAPANQPAPPNPANNDDLFADIPIAGQPPQAKQRPPVESVKDDLFADIPVTPQAIEQEPSLWGQFKAGMADVASGYYSNKALQQAEEYQAIKDNKTGLLGLSKLGIYDVNTGVISPNKEQELKEREEEIAAALKKSQEYQTYSENMPMPESVRNFLDPTRESHSSWWEDLKVAPVEIALNVTAKSGPASLLSLGGAMAGGVTAGLPGAMAGRGAVSGRIEYINSIKQGLQEAGIDWTDPQAFISAINNDELMDPIREKGLKRGIAIGTLDAAAAFVGGKVIAPKSLFAKSAAKAQGTNLPAQVVAQAGLGAGGEAAGQYWSEGEITDVRAIAAEAVGEMTFAPVEATATLYSVSRGSKGIAQDRLKATNELLDILNRKRQKAYNSRDPKAIDKANTEFNEYLNIRQELEQQLKNTDAESLLKAEKTLSTVIDAKQRQYNQANAEQRPALERELKELNKRRDVVFDAIHSQGRTIQAPELMEQQEALDLVKADREFRQEQRRAEEEELYHKRTNPLAAADEEARKIAEQGGDALDQQLGASNAYSTARSTDEMADDIASMEGARQATEREQDLIEEIRRTEQQFADSQGLKKIVAQKKLKNLQQQLLTLRSQQVEEAPTDVSDTNVVDIATPTTPTEEPYQPKSLYQIVREGKERRAREGDWEAAEAQAQVQQAGQTQQEIAAWEASQGITEQEAIQQRRQENLHNELRKAWQQVHQQSVNEAHGIIDEAMALGLIDDEASARQLADNGEIPPDLPQRIANEKRLLAREKAETDREAFVEKQQHRQKVARLEQHIADQQKARDYELALQQRDENLGDITEGEINDWEDRLGITQETAIDEAAQARQARQPAPEPVAEPTAEALLAERVRYAHQVVDAAITNGSIGLLGEPIARQYADRGEIPPSLMSEADQLADQISRLEQHIQSGQMADQARTGWTAEQPAPGAMQEQGATEYTPVEPKPPEQPIAESKNPVNTTPEINTESDNSGQANTHNHAKSQGIHNDGISVGIPKTLVSHWVNLKDPTANLAGRPEQQIAKIMLKEINSLSDQFEKVLNTGQTNLFHDDGSIVSVADFLKVKIANSKTLKIIGTNRMDAVGRFIKAKMDGSYTGTFKEWFDTSGHAISDLEAMANATPTTEQPKQTEQTPEKRRLITNQEREAQEEARFEQQLQQIGREWIKDQQHRFYFSDIIKDLAGTDQQIPGNAKLWYDKRTGFYGSENLDDAVYDAAVERLELLRQSIIDEHGEQALEPFAPESEPSLNNETIKSLNNEQRQAPAEQPPTTTRPADFGKNDKIFTEEKVAADRERIRSKLSQFNSGFDPEMAADMFALGGYYIEGGYRKFKDFSAGMIEEFGDAVKPYLKSAYESVRMYPELAEQVKEMDSHDFVANTDIDELLYQYQNIEDIDTALVNGAEQAGKEVANTFARKDWQDSTNLRGMVAKAIMDYLWTNDANETIKEKDLSNLSHQIVDRIVEGKTRLTASNETIKPLNNDQDGNTPLEDMKALYRDLINQRNELEATNRVGDDRLDRKIAQTKDAIKELEQEQTEQGPTVTTEETETFDPKEFSNVEGNLADLTVDNLKAIGESQKYGLNSIAQRLGRSVTDPQQLYDIIQDHIALLDKIPFHIKKTLRAQLEKDQWDKTIPFSKLSDKVLADLREVLPVKYFDINQHRLDLSYIAREIQLEAEGKIHKEDRTPRGFTQESGSHTFNKEDDSTETFSYNRIADMNKVSGSPELVAPFFVELKEGDLLLDRSGRKMGVVSHTKGGKIHFKGEREPWPINVEVHKDDRRKLGDEIRSLKAEQKGKPAPAPTTPTTTTEETTTGTQWVKITPDDLDQLPIGSTIRISTGTPKPTQAKKLKEWEKYNVTGTLKEKGNYGGTPHLTLFKGMNGFMPNQSMYPMSPDLIFEVEQQPGTVSDNETIKSLNNDQEQGATTAPQGNRNTPIDSAKFNTPLEFGKHKGKTINEIGAEDRGYLRWLADTSMKRNALISDHAGEWLDTNGQWSTDEITEAATLARENILNNEGILSGKETSAEITRRMGKKDQVVTITPYPNHLQIETTTYTTKYGGGRSKEIREQTRRNEYTYKALSEILTDQEVSQLKKLADNDTVESPPSIETTSETTPDEGTRTTGQGTLEGVPPGEVQETTGSGNPGERSPDHTGQGSGYDHGTDGRRSGDELGGSPAPGVSGVDIHGAGAVSQGEVGTGGTDRAGGINSDSVDYSITAQDEIESASFSDTQKYQGNIAAIKLLKELGQRPATLDQKKVLAKYVGWGGLKQAFYREDGTTRKGWEEQAAELKALLTPEEYEAARASTLNAHYTSWDVVHPIFQALKNIGFTGGRILEPSMGVGNFFGMMPTDMRRKSRLVGVELDNITGGIAQKLYGNSARIHAPRGFESFDLADGTYDVVIGNPPFGDETITDAKRKDISGFRIHNYFFAKGMKALRPGGVMAMVVSKGFMDSTANQKGRDMMYREARLLGAFRLPNQAFKANANADVTTDIIFLQKRETPLEGDIETVNDYRNRATFVGADGNTMQINQYFVDNPKHLLGDMIMNTGRFGPDLEPAMTTRKGLDWKKALIKGVARLEGRYDPEANIELSSVTGTPDASTDIQRAEIDGLYINDQGQLSRRLPDLEGDTQGKPVTSYTNNQGKVIELKPAQINKLTDAVKLARKARHLINMQVTDMTDPQLEPLRQELSRDYDAFVKKYHMLNRPLFKSLLSQTDLTIAPMLFALENGYKKERKVDGKTVKESSSKADIFTRRTQEPFTQVTKVSSAEEALIVALSQTGKVDLDRMSELSGISRTALVSQLTDIIYDDPVAGWVTRDEYLSGNVKRKLRQAKEMGRGYEDNVKALEAVQPVDIPATEIITTLGAHWQTPEVINQFWAHLGGQLAQSTFVPERSTWTFTGSETSGKHKWRTDEMTMKDLVKSLLNNKAIAVYKTDPITEKRTLDVRATDAALAKATEIQNEFLAWLWRDTQRREAMVRRYNDLVNTDVNRQFDGSFLTFPGKVSDDIVKLRKTQANAVWRIVQSATTLLDHVVGAGKTFTMVAAAMELKRTGLAKKPMIVVPNHLVAQWAEDFARLYPNAKILAATKQDFSAKRRKEMLARIATGNWDAVIIAHSSFGKMPTDPETQQWFIRKQIEELTVAANALRETEGKGTRSVREAENARKKLREKLKELIENTDKDVGMTWNETGVDALFVDEAHEFKNLQFFTSMNRVKNINPAGSKKAQDLFIKIQALLNKTGGRNLVFATGTPVSNSMAELYTMQRYLSHEQLVESGTNHFDAWARTFGTTVTNQERTSSGKYGPVSRFSEFINLPELITKYKGFADTINNEDIRKALAEEGKGIHIPTVKGGKPQAIVAPRSVYQEAYMGQIEYRFENMPEDPRVDNPLKATNDARKAGLDMRMIYPELPDDPSSKINKSVKNMMRLYDQWSEDKGTQLVFCDLSTPKSQQAKEIKDFRTMVEEAAKDDDNPQNTKGMDVQELYDYLQTMADNGNEKAISRLEKVTQDDIEGWNSKFDVYNDVKTKLMEAGVPEAEIAFIHNANTDTQKQDLFDKVNRGEIRFLLGSTAKMGAGTNVQERLVGLHHLDAPWRPSDLEQREGRIIRQGNKLFMRDPAGFEVEILRYATEQTYDVNMWQMLEVKALFIQQLRNGSLTDRTAKDVGGEAASAAEMKAASSGDPRIIEQVALLARLKTLDNLRQTHIKDKTQATIKAESLEQNKRSLPATIESYRQDYERREIPKEGPGLKTPNGKTFKKSTDGSKWFKQQILTRLQDTESDIWFGAGEVIGEFQGFEVLAKLTEVQSIREEPVYNLRLDLSGKRDYFIVSEDIENIKWDGLFTRFNNAIERIDTERAKRQNQLDNIDGMIKEQEEIARSPFKEEAEYQQKLERNLALIEELGNEDTVNEPAKLLAEYQLLSALAEDYFNRTSENIAETLENTALGNRANKLARRILYSKEGDEKIQATEAIEQARDQGLTITEKEIKAAQKRIDEAEAQRKLEEKKIKENAKNTGESTQVTTVTTDTTITFTSADEAIKHAQESKQAITADNGNIRLERSSLGNWQLSVAWRPDQEMDSDSIAMDTDLALMTGGRGFTAVGDKMVMTFMEDRLPVVIRRLYGKMPLQGVKADKTEKAANVRFRKTDNSDIVYFSESDVSEYRDHISEEEANKEIERFRQEYNLHDVNFEVYRNADESGYDFDGDKRNSKGMFLKGQNTVLMFYGRYSSISNFREALRHETFVHLALDRKNPLFQRNIINLLMNSMYKDVELSKLLLGHKEPGILETYKGRNSAVIAEEVLAFLAHPQIQESKKKRILFKINQFFREKFKANIRLSSTEAIGIISSLIDELKNGLLKPKLYESKAQREYNSQDVITILNDDKEIKKLISKVKVIDRIWELPKHLRSSTMMKQKGFYDVDNDTVYIIAKNIKNPNDAISTLLHEVVGHKGLRYLLKGQFDNYMLSIYGAMSQDQKDAMLNLYGDEIDTLNNKQEEYIYIAEEYLSFLAETNPSHSFISKAIAVLKQFFRKIFKSDIKWTHDDFVHLLSKSRQEMMKQDTEPLIPKPSTDTGNIRFRSQDNSVTITSPNNSNNPADNANRLFSTLALAENKLIKNTLKVTGRKASSGMAHFRKLMLPTMGLRQIVDTYESVFDPMAADIDTATNTSKGNPIQKYQRYVQGMQSLKANKLAEADNVDKQWGELAKANPTEYNALADMMHEATVYEVFPEKDYFIEHENMRELRRDYAREQNSAKQAELRKRIMFERERLTVYNKLSEQYQQMSQQAKDVYQAVEGFHEDMWNDHQKALEDKITRSMQNSDEARAFIQQLKAQFHEAKVRGPYFPLQRFGSFYLIAEDQQGVYYREHYETEAQLYKHKEEIEKAGMSVLSFGLMPDFTSRKLEGVSGFADQIHLALESDKFANVSAAIKDDIRTEINQLALQMLPDVSAAKSMIRRRKVKGYSDNARRAFAFSSIHQSNRLARTIYGDQMTAELERIHDDIDSHNENPLMDMAHRTIAAQVLSVLEKQHETIMNPKGSPIAARITNMAFIWYLGASAGAGFINMSQTLLIGIPLMGGRFGYRKTTAAVAKAAKDFGLHGYNKMSLRESMFTLSKATQGVTDDEKRMLQQLIDDGTIDTTQTSTLSQIADQDLRAEAQVNQDRWVKINRLLGYFFHNAEVANREVTALASYRMAIAEGQTHENAVEIARKLTFDSHFDYSGANRPLVMKNDWVKVFTIFKQYSQNMTYTLVRNFVKSRPFSKFSPAEKTQARKALFGILVAHATAAGTLGLPLVSIIGPVLAEAFGDDDDEFRDWKTMYRNWLSDLVGKDMGHAIAKGVFNGFMGTDIHARVKIDDLWIQEPNWEMSAREESMHYLLQGLGPASSAAINVLWLGPEQIADGNTWKGIEKMVPKFIRDGMRTIRYANEGATVGRGGYQAMIEEFTPGELARQFLGISPSRVSEGYEARGAVKNLEQKISGRRGELMQGYTRAYMDGDYEKANEILTEIQTFNVSNPLYGITGDALRQSLRMKYRYKELSQSGIYLPEAKMGLLNEARFAL